MKDEAAQHEGKRTASEHRGCSRAEPAKKLRKFFVHVDRKAGVQSARLELPVCMHEQEIVEAIHANDVVLITGATGTGKTTQVPQFLVEDGFGDARSADAKGMVAVTQPRRVAAVACAKRVAFEMNSKLAEVVGYQIRHEARLSDTVKVKFVTDGVLLREVEHDMLLKKYSAVVIDEVHERSLNTDMLMSFLSRSIVLRKEQKEKLGCLKVIVMSATLDIEGVFSGSDALFPNPPVVKVPSRQYPVTMHFARQTVSSYAEEAFRKVSKIHRRLPPGGVLVFLSGRHEVEYLCSLLRKEFGDRKVSLPDSEGVELGIRVLPFYALLSDNQQRAVFDDVGEENRKVVVATNIAETSVTVPGIAYVVDSGRVKEKVFKGRGSNLLSAFEVRWVSKASAEQRAGRAGRTGPGHCYRLYSSAVYDQQFEEFRQPEMRRVPADTIVLRLRAMGIRHVHKFPFPTAPDRAEISAAERLLTDLGALHAKGRVSTLRPSPASGSGGVLLGVTHIGRDLARLPVSPRFGRMLLAAKDLPGVLPYASRLAGALSVGTVLDRTQPDFRARHAALLNRRGDALTELAAVCAAEHAGLCDGKRNVSAVKEFCRRHALHGKAVVEALAVCDQLGKLFGGEGNSEKALQPPGREIEDGVVRALLCGFADRVARRMSRQEAAARGVIPKHARRAFCVHGEERPVFLEGGSGVSMGGGVEFVCFAELVEIELKRRVAVVEDDKRDDYESSDGEGDGASAREQGRVEEEEEAPKVMKVVLRGATVVRAEWLAEEATALCAFLPSREASAVFDRSLDVVVEEARVFYGGARWLLGSRRVPVEVVDAAGGGKGREAERATAFARALLGGKVRPWLKAGLGGGGVGEAVVVGVARRLKGLTSVKGLVRELNGRGDFLSAVVEAGCRRGVSEWRDAVKKLAKEGDGEVEKLCAVRDDEDEDEYGG